MQKRSPFVCPSSKRKAPEAACPTCRSPPARGRVCPAGSPAAGAASPALHLRRLRRRLRLFPAAGQAGPLAWADPRPSQARPAGQGDWAGSAPASRAALGISVADGKPRSTKCARSLFQAGGQSKGAQLESVAGRCAHRSAAGGRADSSVLAAQ